MACRTAEHKLQAQTGNRAEACGGGLVPVKSELWVVSPCVIGFSLVLRRGVTHCPDQLVRGCSCTDAERIRGQSTI